MADWYEKGMNILLDDIHEATEVDKDTVSIIYSHLVNIGLIDYDVEKEYILENYWDESWEDE